MGDVTTTIETIEALGSWAGAGDCWGLEGYRKGNGLRTKSPV